VDLLDFEDEQRLFLAAPGLSDLLANYLPKEESQWSRRWDSEAISSRELRRIHALAVGAGWLEISAGNPDAPEDLRQTARYRLTRAGKTVLQAVSQTQE